MNQERIDELYRVADELKAASQLPNLSAEASDLIFSLAKSYRKKAVQHGHPTCQICHRVVGPDDQHDPRCVQRSQAAAMVRAINRQWG